jgi:hypothetical protein
MSAMKQYLEEVALREFGEVTEESMEKARPIAQRDLDAAQAAMREHPPVFFRIKSKPFRRVLEGEGGFHA